ncbi:MAG: flagellar basal body P-ring formation chaperone FlgA [Pseudolabrys sp.]
MIRTLLAALALTGLATAALAQDTPRPVLKASATVTGDIVRVGDLIDNAGVIANVPIFRAPDLGTTGTVKASAVADAVRGHALVGLDTAGLSEVSVTRAARAIPAEEVEEAIAQALAAQHPLGEAGDITVTFEREMRAMYVDPAATGAVRVARVTFEPRSGRFDATLEIPTGAARHGTFRLTGRAHATMDVVTVLRRIERGAVLKETDVAIERHPRNSVGRDAITDRSQAIGLAARTELQPGRPLRGAELKKPELVQRNDTVTMIYEVPGIMLSVRGKAMESGAEGDTIAVLNEQSKRTVHGVVVGPGHVVIGAAPPPRLAATERRAELR